MSHVSGVEDTPADIIFFLFVIFFFFLSKRNPTVVKSKMS